MHQDVDPCELKTHGLPHGCNVIETRRYMELVEESLISLYRMEEGFQLWITCTRHRVSP